MAPTFSGGDRSCASGAVAPSSGERSETHNNFVSGPEAVGAQIGFCGFLFEPGRARGAQIAFGARLRGVRDA